MKIYIAGPMRFYRHYNFGAFRHACNILRKDGHDVVSPHELDLLAGFDPYDLPDDYDWGQIPDGFDFDDCVTRDIKAVRECEGIYMLKGWEKSTGACAELSLAKWLGKTVIYEITDEAMTAQERKEYPIYSGVVKYFPDALMAVSHCSWKGNEQHNPGTKLHWDRSKSGDELDALMRHLVDAGTFDSDGVRHSTKVAWRALANLQKELEG